MGSAAELAHPVEGGLTSGLAELVRKRLGQRGMTQDQFAKSLGISRKHLSQLLSGRARLVGDLSRALPEAVGVPPGLFNSLLSRGYFGPPPEAGWAKDMIVWVDDPTASMEDWEAG